MNFNPFKRLEKRAGSNFTQNAITSLYALHTSTTQGAELLGVVQTCAGMWERGMGQARSPHPYLTPSVLSKSGRSLALTGNSVWWITEDGLVPVSAWEVSTRNGKVSAYRLTIPDVSGGHTVTALPAEVLHFRIAVSNEAPWQGTSPLTQASLSHGLLAAVESALSDTYQNAPVGSQVVPYPESNDVDMDKLSSSFKGKRGGVLMRESTSVAAAGGVAPATDWKAVNLTPELDKSLLVQTMDSMKGDVYACYGILETVIRSSAAGTTIKEASRYLAQWTLQPIAKVMGEEASTKLGEAVEIDVVAGMQAYDEGSRARSVLAMVKALAAAKEAGLTDDQVKHALSFAGVYDQYSD